MAGRAKSGSATRGEVRLPPLEEFTTHGGMKVIVARREPIPLVSVRLVLLGGGATDPAGRFGMADFTARLLRRGSAERTADQINDAVEFVGASLASGASEDFSAVNFTTPAKHLEPMLEVMASLVREPTFPEGEVESARRRVLAHLANDLDDPGLVADRALTHALWGDHPYGHDTGGTERDVARFTRDDVVAFHKARFGPRVAMLVIVGAVDPARVRKSIERLFGDWTGGPDEAPKFPAREKAALAGRVLLIDKPEQTQSQIRLGGMAIRRGGPGWLPASVMNTILGGGFTSRLVKEIRVKRGLSYGAGSGFDGMMAGGTFSVSSFTKTESTSELIAVARDELAKMHARGPTEKELDTARTYMAGLYPLRLETNESVAAAIAETRLFDLGDDWVTNYRERVRAVTRKEAQEVARRLLPVEHPAVVVVGNAAKVKKHLKGLGPIEVKAHTEIA